MCWGGAERTCASEAPTFQGLEPVRTRDSLKDILDYKLAGACVRDNFVLTADLNFLPGGNISRGYHFHSEGISFETGHGTGRY